MKHQPFNFDLEEQPVTLVLDLDFTIIDEYTLESEDNYDILLESYGYMQQYNLNVEFEDSFSYILHI